MVAHSSGRLVPVRPRGRRREPRPARRGLPGRHPHAATGAGEVTAFYLGTTGTLTAVGIVLSALVLVRELGFAGARARGRPRARAPARAAQGARARPGRLAPSGPSPSGSAAARGGCAASLPCARGGRARRGATPPTPARGASCSCAASRSGVRRPSPSASATAQPGSPSWRQSAKRQLAGELLDVGEHARQPARLLPDPRELEPRRVDHHAAARPAARARAWWWCGGRGRRPRGSGRSPGRRPRGALSNVVLPTPEAPSSTPVTPGPEQRARRRRCRVPSTVETGSDRRGAGHRGAHLGHARVRIGGEVGLREDDERVGGRVGGQREHALDAAEVELAVQRRDDDHEVDVGGEDLRLAAVARRAHERARALASTAWTAPGLGVVGDVVADRGQVDGRWPRGAAAGDEARARAVVGDSSRPPRWTAATRASASAPPCSATGGRARGAAGGREWGQRRCS